MYELPPYPEYRYSGVSWLGEIPEHWSGRKLRNVLTPVSKRNRPDLPLLSVVRKKGVIKRNISNKEENHNYIPDDLTNYKIVKIGQFAMNKMKAWQGSYGISKYDGIVSPAYFVFDLSEVLGDFFHVTIRSKAYIPFFTRSSDGVRVGQWDLNQTRMKEIPFFVPEPEEQTQIARFLDWKTAQINKFISNKRGLIALLKEQKQNIINQAVTRGINPNVKLKPSGVEWIGDIPEHWEVRMHRRVLKKIEQGWSPVAENRKTEAGEWGVIKISAVSKGRFIESEQKALSVGDSPKSQFQIHKGDFLLTRGNTPALVGDVCVVDAVNDQLMISDLVYRLSYDKNEMNPLYAMFWFLSTWGRNQISSIAFGSSLTMVKVSQKDIKSWPLPLPPRKEQQQIVSDIERQSVPINQAITRAEREIELMREYRARLISDVVTGKVDVRGVNVPEISLEELLAVDEDVEEAENSEEILEAEE